MAETGATMKKGKVMLILYIVLGVILVFLVVVAVQPSEFKISRAATIAAPPEAVFAQVNDLHRWEAWSPWAKLDPNAKNAYDGPPSGVGAAFTWSGNSELGEGRLTITESRPHELVRFKLDFVRPFACTNSVEFTFEPEGDRTAVTWNMAGTNNFIAKAVGLFMDCDKMVGGQFEQGFADLKSVVESTAKQ